RWYNLYNSRSVCQYPPFRLIGYAKRFRVVCTYNLKIKMDVVHALFPPHSGKGIIVSGCYIGSLYLSAINTYLSTIYLDSYYLGYQRLSHTKHRNNDFPVVISSFIWILYYFRLVQTVISSGYYSNNHLIFYIIIGHYYPDIYNVISYLWYNIDIVHTLSFSTKISK